jgi:hypothetical protein
LQPEKGEEEKERRGKGRQDSYLVRKKEKGQRPRKAKKQAKKEREILPTSKNQ